MATVDLSELIPDLKAAITAPGLTGTYDNVGEEEWVTRLNNAFWTAYNEGMITGFVVSTDGIVSSPSNVAMGRDLQQLILMYAAINIVQNQLLQIKTLFRAKAGPVEYETQQSANVLKALLDSLLSQKAIAAERVASMVEIPTFYLDMVATRDNALRSHLIDWNY